MTHGRRSKLRRYGRLKHRLGDLIEEFEDDPEPLSMHSELAAARALLHEQLVELAEQGGQPANGNGHSDGRPFGETMQAVEAVSRIVKRIEDIRSQDAVSRPELARIWSEMLRVVQMECEEEQARRIAEGWKRIRL